MQCRNLTMAHVIHNSPKPFHIPSDNTTRNAALLVYQCCNEDGGLID